MYHIVVKVICKAIFVIKKIGKNVLIRIYKYYLPKEKNWSIWKCFEQSFRITHSAGNIIPNSKLGGGVSVTNIINVSVDASGSAVSGSSADGNQLGQQLAGAIQAELIKQKRAGGLLA